ncbi:hypothetical protein [Sanguibacter suaedae]|uniref:Uncharacterized protein n=1 Tax=Sanguibacter suaedae TaxID=2795737 RepID=A0A934IAB1_9MICO|nr:hypothetical protein [Sanguibacter suaedae]MBI9114802.1 hypothetical protein [Sanguibacter suaedae]
MLKKILVVLTAALALVVAPLATSSATAVDYPASVYTSTSLQVQPAWPGFAPVANVRVAADVGTPTGMVTVSVFNRDGIAVSTRTVFLNNAGDDSGWPGSASVSVQLPSDFEAGRYTVRALYQATEGSEFLNSQSALSGLGIAGPASAWDRAPLPQRDALGAGVSR